MDSSLEIRVNTTGEKLGVPLHVMLNDLGYYLEEDESIHEFAEAFNEPGPLSDRLASFLKAAKQHPMVRTKRTRH